MIVLYTDFGLQGPYTGQVEAVLQQQAPGVPVISLFADLPPFDVRAAAYLLPAYSRHLPPATIALCVVDPGVGGDRPGVVVRADHRWYVGPNEGLFAILARRAGEVQCWQLPVVEDASPSFHGREHVAPVAAQLARGLPPRGEPAAASVLAVPDWPDDLAQVVYIDHYGNAVTGLRASAVADDTVFEVNGQVVQRATTFADVGAGTAFWYENANGLVELAVNRGRADTQLAVGIGSALVMR